MTSLWVCYQYLKRLLSLDSLHTVLVSWAISTHIIQSYTYIYIYIYIVILFLGDAFGSLSILAFAMIPTTCAGRENNWHFSSKGDSARIYFVWDSGIKGVKALSHKHAKCLLFYRNARYKLALIAQSTFQLCFSRHQSSVNKKCCYAN